MWMKPLPAPLPPAERPLRQPGPLHPRSLPPLPAYGLASESFPNIRFAVRLVSKLSAKLSSPIFPRPLIDARSFYIRFAKITLPRTICLAVGAHQRYNVFRYQWVSSLTFAPGLASDLYYKRQATTG